jgi:hypothetical protein
MLDTDWSARSDWIVLIACILIIGAAVFKLLYMQKRKQEVSSAIATAFTLGGVVVGLFSQTVMLRILDRAASPVRVDAFIESVHYGYPTVVVEDRRGNVRQSVELFIGSLQSHNTEIFLTQQEADTLSKYADRFAANESDLPECTRPAYAYQTSEIAGDLRRITNRSYEFRSWVHYLEKWAKFINDKLEENILPKTVMNLFHAKQLRPVKLKSLILGEVSRSRTTSWGGLCRAVGEIDSCRRYGDGLAYIEIEDWSVLMQTRSGRPADPRRQDCLCSLMKGGRAEDLAVLFQVVAKDLTSRARSIDLFIESWGKFLTSRRKDRLEIRVTFVNGVRYNSFVRATGKIVVGSRNGRVGSQAEILLVALDKMGKRVTNPFLQVEGLQAKSHVFEAVLDSAELVKRLDGFWNTKSAYLSSVFLVNAGDAERATQTPAVPFSIDPQSLVRDRLMEMGVTIE